MMTRNKNLDRSRTAPIAKSIVAGLAGLLTFSSLAFAAPVGLPELPEPQPVNIMPDVLSWSGRHACGSTASIYVTVFGGAAGTEGRVAVRQGRDTWSQPFTVPANERRRIMVRTEADQCLSPSHYLIRVTGSHGLDQTNWLGPKSVSLGPAQPVQ